VVKQDPVEQFSGEDRYFRCCFDHIYNHQDLHQGSTGFRKNGGPQKNFQMTNIFGDTLGSPNHRSDMMIFYMHIKKLSNNSDWILHHKPPNKGIFLMISPTHRQFPRTSHWGRSPILLYHISQTPKALVFPQRCQGARNITEVQPSLLGFAATFGQQTSTQRGWPSRKGQIPLKQSFNLCWNNNNNDNKWINGYPQENRKGELYDYDTTMLGSSVAKLNSVSFCWLL